MSKICMLKIIKWKRKERRPTYMERHTVFMNLKIHIGKMPMLLKLNAIPAKISTNFLIYIQVHSKIWMHREIPRTAKTILKKDNKVGGIIRPNVKAYYWATVMRQSFTCRGIRMGRGLCLWRHSSREIFRVMELFYIHLTRFYACVYP